MTNGQVASYAFCYTLLFLLYPLIPWKIIRLGSTITILTVDGYWS